MFQPENTLILAGEVVTPPSFSHKTHECTFLHFTLSIFRLSGTCDKISVLAESSLLDGKNIIPGDFVEICGELRSYNNKSGIGNKLIVTAFARSVSIVANLHKNELKLSGTICKTPTYRRTPLGREICDLMVAINRKYGRADYLPCISWGKNAQIASSFSVGDNISICGRVQSREYIKVIDGVNQVRTTYEVSVSIIELL